MMPPIEDLPATIVKSPSIDGSLNHETFSCLEIPDRIEAACAVTWQNDEEDDDEDERNFGEPKVGQEQGGTDQARSKSSHSGKRFFACFSPATARHILPRPMMSPGRDGRRGNDFAGIHRAAVHLSAALTYSAPLGSIPHSGPLKIGGGSIAGHLAPLKVLPKGHSCPFTMMPADVIGKRKPSGYESEEPTSPEVTCIGRVRIKHKHWAKAVEENAFKDPRKDNLVMKRQHKKKEKKETESPRRWIWPFSSRKEAKKVPPIEEQYAELYLRRYGSTYVVSMMPDENEEDAKEFAFNEESSKEGERMERAASNNMLPMKGDDRNWEVSNAECCDKEGEAPLPNVLLLMRGCSRNWDRPNDSGVTPGEEAALIVMPVLPNTKNETRAEENATVPMRGDSKSMNKQSLLLEEKGSIWKRRSFAKPCTLDVRNSCRMELGIKQPMTT